MALEAKARTRLVRFLTIAEQSNSDGEAINALRQAVKLCAAAKVSLADALAVAGTAAIDVARLTELERAAFSRGVASGEDRAKQAFAATLATSIANAAARGRTEGEERAKQVLGEQFRLAEAEAKRVADRQAANAAKRIDQAYRQGMADARGEAAGVNHPLRPQQPPLPVHSAIGGTRGWRDAARELAAMGGLRERESEFVTSLLARSFPTLTPKQDGWLRDLCAREGVKGW